MTIKTAREKWMLTFLPAVLVAVVYLWAYGRPLAMATTSVSAEVEKAREGDTARRAAGLLRQCEQLGDEIDNEKSAAIVADASLGLNGSLGNDRTRTLKTITEVLGRNHLQLLSTLVLTEASANGGVDALAKDLSSKVKLPAPQFWKFEFTGNYTDTVNALKAIGALRDFAVPTAIEMNPADVDATERRWSLTVWM